MTNQKPTKAQLRALYIAEIAFLTPVSRFAHEVRINSLKACCELGWLKYQPYAQKGDGLWKFTEHGKQILDQYCPEEK